MIHTVLICFQNPEQTLIRWRRDVAPAAARAHVELGLNHPFVSVIDNSPSRSDSLGAFFGRDYHWMRGENLMYGGAINYAVRQARPSAFTVYCCSRHGTAFDDSWMIDLLRPMIADPVVGVTGCLWGSNSPEGVAHDIKRDWPKDGRYTFTHADGIGYVPQHIQGGVYAARTEVLLRCPYHDDCAHLYSDHTLTWDTMRAGYKCVDVPSVRSVWRQVWRDQYSMEGIRYLHDEEHT